MRARPALLLATLLAAGPVAAADATPPCHAHPKAGTTETPAARSAYAAPEVTLVDQRGRAVKLKELLDSGRPVVLDFIFTSCRSICPVLSASFVSLQREVGDGVDYISISIDPEYDTPAVLAAYAERFRVGPRWSLLTGKAADVVAVQKAFAAFSGGKESHRPLTFVRAAGSREWTRYEGFPTTATLAASLVAAPGAGHASLR